MNGTTYLKCLSDSKNSLSATLKSLCIESKRLLIELTGGWIFLDVFFAESKIFPSSRNDGRLMTPDHLEGSGAG